MESYSPSKIEKKWQKAWEENGLYQADNQPLSAFRHPSSQSVLSSQISDFAEGRCQREDGGNERGGQRADDRTKPKFYVLVEFPYPSGAGLHVGHVRAWSAMDAYVRKKRMEGKNVLFPIGWDAFGLPAENYAIKMGVHPSITTQENILTFKKQIKSLGLSFDWGREINTTDPKYYKWTQWIFLKLLEHGLAYQKEVPVNWCPSCRTNLADEEVLSDGTHERCGKPTEKRLQKQWLLAITKYADRLIDGLKSVDFPSKVSVQQVNWIGRSEGVHIDFKIVGTDKKLSIFTTAHDTIFGATFMVVSPEHTLVAELLSSPVIASGQLSSRAQRGDLDPHGASLLGMTPNSQIASGRTLRNDNVKIEEVRKYVERAKSKSEQDRIAEGKEKTGVNTGLKVINPFTNEEIPVFVADYVLMQYGTGAVMGVPGHDKRDHDFAVKYGLSIKIVIKPDKEIKVGSDGFWNYSDIKSTNTSKTTLFNSDILNGLTSHEARKKIEEEIEKREIGNKVVNYHLHDWIFSRQHYWGEPIPVVHCPKCGVVPVPEKDLPVELPYVEKYEPSGTQESPLSTMTDWVNTICSKCGGLAQRETDTMPNWAGSNWYYLAYLFADKLGSQNLVSRHAEFISASQAKKEIPKQVRDDSSGDIFSQNRDLIDYWMPVDIYEGGYEHTTLHLLYSRFIYKFLFDIGVVPSPEPYARRRVHGVVLGPDNRKMSKSLGNVINPDEIVEKFGADSLRLYEMFMGPYADSVAWNTNGVMGVYRFLSKVWILFISTDFSGKTVEEKPDGFKASTRRVEESTAKGKVNILLSKLVNKVSSDLENMKFNTAVSAFMEFTNELITHNLQLTTDQWDIFLRILAPFAPHLAEELYQGLRVDVIANSPSSSRAERGDLAQIASGGTLAMTKDTPQNDESFVSVHNQSWPEIENIKSEEDLTIAVQVDGKVRDIIIIKNSEVRIKDEKLIEIEAIKSEKIKKYLEGKSYKIIYVQGKVINFVVIAS